MPGDERKWIPNSMIAGAGAGLIASIVICPLEVVKTKLQAQRAVHGQLGYQGALDVVKTTLRRDGIRGMYRGLGPTILGYLPSEAIYFTVYDGIKQGYQPVMRDHPWTLHVMSAMIAGAANATCTNPLWVIKTRFMTQSRREIGYRHTFDAALTMYRTEGIRAFYRGLIPSLFGITHVAIKFPLYEQFKTWAQGDSTAPLHSGTIVLCTVSSKLIATVLTYPHEVVRTRLQVVQPPSVEDLSLDGTIKAQKKRNIIYITRKIIRKEGWTGLYKGLSVNLFRSVLYSTVTVLPYELLKRHSPLATLR